MMQWWMLISWILSHQIQYANGRAQPACPALIRHFLESDSKITAQIEILTQELC